MDDAIPDFDGVGLDGSGGDALDDRAGGEVEDGVMPGAGEGAAVAVDSKFAFAQRSAGVGATVGDAVKLTGGVDHDDLAVVGDDDAAAAGGQVRDGADFDPLGTFGPGLVFVGDGRAGEGVERFGQSHAGGGVKGSVAEGKAACLGFAQLLDEVEEVGGLVGLESDDELVVVEAEAVGGVEPDAGVLAADADVLVHEGLAFVVGEPVPISGLHERVDEEVAGFGWLDDKLLIGFVLEDADVVDGALGLREK